MTYYRALVILLYVLIGCAVVIGTFALIADPEKRARLLAVYLVMAAAEMGRRRSLQP